MWLEDTGPRHVCVTKREQWFLVDVKPRQNSHGRGPGRIWHCLQAGRRNATSDRGCAREFHVAKPRRPDRKWYDKSVRLVFVRTGGEWAMFDFKYSC